MKDNITHIHHIAIVVKSINEVKHFYENALGLKIDHIEEIKERGIKTAFMSVGEVKIELIEPITDNSEVSSFLAKKGPGIHHIAFGTNNIVDLTNQITLHNIEPIYKAPQKGAHNTKVNFIHPKNSGGVLMEIVEDD